MAERIARNLDHIEQHAPKPGEADQDRAPFSDTQLLVSLLGVLVFPHERVRGALGELLLGYESLGKAVEIQYLAPWIDAKRIDLALDGDAKQTVDPNQVRDLPRLLRNSLAHFHVLPLQGQNGLFGGIRVWNEDRDKNVTLVADLPFNELRPLAKHVLKALARPEGELNLDDPEDPLPGLLAEPPTTPHSRKIPKLNDSLWEKLLSACDGDPQRAKKAMDKAIKDAAQRLAARKEPA